MRRKTLAWPMTVVAAVAGFVVLLSNGQPTPRAAGTPKVPAHAREQAIRDGRTRVIVATRLASPHVPEGLIGDAARVLAQRQAIAAKATQVMDKLPGGSYSLLRRFVSVPYIVLDATPAALDALDPLDDDVQDVWEDEVLRTKLANSVPLIEGDLAWAAGYDGTGQTIAILDSGVDSTHPFLAGKVVEEACYSTSAGTTSQTFCPNGLSSQIGAGSAAPCPLPDCIHGTHVAGIAAGQDPISGLPPGVAKGANIMAVQVFSKITDAATCGGAAPCVGAFTSDIISGLERVYTVALAGRPIAAVNMSLGGTNFDAPCDSEPYKPMIDTLRSIGIASVIAAGNDGSPFGLSSPACISTAVSVSSTDKSDVVSRFSNVAPFLSLFAPGEAIVSSVPGGGYAPLSGTSMAAPHVAGAWAILKQAVPGASVTTLLNALQTTGLPITDERYSFIGIETTIPRIRIFEALRALVPISSDPPVVTSLTPSSARVGYAFTLTVNGTGFNGTSVVEWNGSARTTHLISSKTLQASILASDVPAVGTAQVRVTTPPPGGGTSASLTFTITPPPSLTANASLFAPNDPVTVTLANGFGGSNDWLALAATGSPDSNFVAWTYVGAGVTNRTWATTMPATGGTYEFRLFVNNARAATSPPVTVDATRNPLPVLTSISPGNAAAGGAGFSMTLTGTGFASSSVALWNGSPRPTTFTTSREIHAAIAPADLAAAGSVAVTVQTPGPGGGSSAPVAFTINPAPSIAVSATSVTGGASVTATLTNGIGGAYDWLALAATSAPNTTYLQYIYIGAGVTTKTWTVTMPATPGTYEFRLFLNNGYTRAATSPPISIASGTPTLTSLSPGGASLSGAAFTLTVNGSGFATSSVVRWNGSGRTTTYVNGSQLTAAIPASDLTVSGAVQVTVYTPPPGGGVSTALTFNIGGSPILTPSATTVPTGSPLTVTLTGGLGGSTDWIAFASSSAPNTSYLQYTYIGAGVTTKTWTVTAPSTPGTYEFRLFLNNGFTRAATSPPITVTSATPVPNPVPTISSLSPSRTMIGTPVSVVVSGTGFVSGSIVRWNGQNRATTYSTSTSLTATLLAADVASIGTGQITVFSPTPGGGVSLSLPFDIIPAPALTVNTTSVLPGGAVTMTLTGGLGGGYDWLGFALTGTPETSYLQYTYVGLSVTTRTWTITVPTTPGTYEFRLYLNNGLVRVATSPTITVSTSAPTVIPVGAGGNLQAAIDAAKPGDTIALEPGATFTGNFTLPAKTGTGVITIRSAAPDSALPGDTSRMNPSYAAYLPKIKSPDSAPAMATKPGAHDYRLMFLEFLPNPNGYYDILDLGDGSSAQNSLAQVPHDLVVDRIYMHGDPILGQKRGIALNSASTTIKNSYIADIKAVGQDSQAVGGYNGPGPFTIANNYLEAAGENILFGGADPPIPNLIPSNITITGNYITKPLSWRGLNWSVKNGLELKSAAHVLIDHNVIENTWLAGQVGTLVLFTVRDQDGGAPWSTITDVTFSNNVVRHGAGFVNILGYDDDPVARPSVRMNGLRIVNNLVYDINPQVWNDPVSGAWGSGRMIQIIGGPQNVEIGHNTMVYSNPNTSPTINGAFAIGQIGDTYLTSGLSVHDNVAAEGDYGLLGDTVGIGRIALDTYAPGWSWLDNLLIRGASGGTYDSLYPTSTTVSPAGATVINAPTMTVVSPYQSLPTTDARTIGADIAIIRAGIPDLDLTH